MRLVSTRRRYNVRTFSALLACFIQPPDKCRIGRLTRVVCNYILILFSSQRQNPAGEWWELFDEAHNLPYYYNTKSGQTEWEKPQDGANVISLCAIQVRGNLCCVCSFSSFNPLYAPPVSHTTRILDQDWMAMMQKKERALWPVHYD